ncbi:MAG TPA: methyltransferase domain-containing protein [Ktedonobacteraceae bacterium]|nr:methyltransferase domain-containing protein [Ktedonobacteraceae bacterium]
MPISPEPRREQPSTYFIQDRTLQEELDRLRVLDYMFTMTMGGVLPEQSNLTSFERVLDVGCGTGGWLIELAKTIPSSTTLIGVDVSLTFIEYARAQAEAAGVSDRVKFHAMDALRMLEFPNASFDLINHRSAASWLRTWDWPKLLQEYQRVARPGAVVRITEPEWVIKSNSPAYARIQEMSVQAFHGAGHLFTPTNEGVTGELVRLLRQHGLQQVQTRVSTQEYRANTPDGQRFAQSIQLTYRNALPFLRKWMHVPENYEEIYQQMLSEMQQPDFVATGSLLTAWGEVASV